MQQRAEFAQPRPQQCVLHLCCQGLDLSHGVDDRFFLLFVGIHLALDDVGRQPRPSGVNEQETILELVDGRLIDAQGIDDDGVLAELDEVEAAEHRCVLVLHAAGDVEVAALDLVGDLGHLVVGERQAMIVLHQADESHDHGRG